LGGVGCGGGACTTFSGCCGLEFFIGFGGSGIGGTFAF